MHSKNRDAKPDCALRKQREITRQKGGGVEQTGERGGLGGVGSGCCWEFCCVCYLWLLLQSRFPPPNSRRRSTSKHSEALLCVGAAICLSAAAVGRPTGRPSRISRGVAAFKMRTLGGGRCVGERAELLLAACVVGFRFCIKSIKTHAFVSYAK